VLHPLVLNFIWLTKHAPFLTATEKRTLIGARCSFEEEERWGDPEGSCDDPSTPVQKVVSKGLWEATHDPSIPEAMRSPAYDLAQLFTLDTLQLGEIFEYRKQYSDPRHAICKWAVDNKEWIEGLLPPGYPREIEKDTSSTSLYIAALVMAALASLVVICTAGSVYRHRRNPAIKASQIEFLALLLLGLFLIAIGAMMTAIPVSEGTCIAGAWLIMVGYTIELVPLLVKISAINMLVHAARGHKRVFLQRRHLFTTVAVITLCVAVYLVVWTVLDPPSPQSGFIFGTSSTATKEGNVVLETAAFCSSNSGAWRVVAIIWNCVLLVAGTVLAFQSRKIKLKDFNESLIVGLMIYSQCIFLIARVVSQTVLKDQVSDSALSYSVSIIFAVDVIVTTLIYFLPKFKKTPLKKKSSYLDFISSSVLERVGSAREKSIPPFSLSSGEAESASISVEEKVPNRHRDPIPFGVGHQCPQCGYTAVPQTDVLQATIDKTMEDYERDFPPEMPLPASEEASTLTPQTRSSTLSNAGINDGQERPSCSTTDPIQESASSSRQGADHSLRASVRDETTDPPIGRCEQSTRTIEA
jgi:7 transmembrane sweet-taste receptor of 3 GCPR